MILIDSNLLIYASINSFPQHQRSREWLDEKLCNPAAVAIPWHCILSFLRISTNPRVMQNAMTMEQSWRIVEGWLACANVWTPHPGETHATILGELLSQPGMKSNSTSDAHLAALAIEHGLILCSNDTDFARFRGLRWENPLK